MGAVPLFDRYLPLLSMHGGMGVVHLCTDLADRHPVALKTIRPELLADSAARDRFIHEASLWLRIGEHPHVVTARQVRRDRDLVYVVSDYVAPLDGASSPSLRPWLGRPADMATTLQVALGIARGMKFAVQRVPGLVHRDLKPENVLLGRDHRARVTDFGLAVIRDEGRHDASGTPGYMAPEQWDGTASILSDIYALGLILLELWTGSTGVTAGPLPAIRAQHEAGTPARHAASSGLPASLRTLVQAAVQANPSKRPPDWHVVEDVLVQAWLHETGQPPPSVPEGLEAQRARRMLDGWSNHALATALAELGQLPEAALGYRAVVKSAIHDEDRQLEAAAVGNLGQTLVSLGELDEALACIERALELKRSAGDTLGEANSLHDRAGVLVRANLPSDALRDYEAAAERFTALGRPGEAATARFNMVPVLAQLGKGDEALAVARDCLSAFRAADDRRGQGAVLGTIGQILRRNGALDDALQCSEDAIACFRAVADRLGEARELSFQGHTLRDMLRMPEALDCFQLSLRLSNEIGDKLLTASNLYALALMLPPGPQLAPMAREYARLAADIYREVGRVDLANDADKVVAQLP